MKQVLAWVCNGLLVLLPSCLPLWYRFPVRGSGEGSVSLPCTNLDFSLSASTPLSYCLARWLLRYFSTCVSWSSCMPGQVHAVVVCRFPVGWRRRTRKQCVSVSVSSCCFWTGRTASTCWHARSHDAPCCACHAVWWEEETWPCSRSWEMSLFLQALITNIPGLVRKQCS